MTTYHPESVVCGACGGAFRHHALGSTNTMGSADLDTRPAEMQRSTMGAWVQRCPSCGYCAADASSFDGRLRAVLDSPRYRSQLEDASCPGLARAFICQGILEEAAGRDQGAAWAYLHAAWVLDDAKSDDIARLWRGRAADRFLALLAAGRSTSTQAGATEAVLVDCLRRAGRGAEALQILERTLGGNAEDIIGSVLRFQRSLIEQGDTSARLISEALQDS